MVKPTNTHILVIFNVVMLILLATLLVQVPNCHMAPPESSPAPITEGVLEEVEEVFEEYRFTNFMTNGTSMYPIICHNEICPCERTNDYQIGDIIVYVTRHPDLHLVAHRIIMEFRENNTYGVPAGYVTKGDNVYLHDTYVVPKELILCEVEHVPLLFRLLRGWY